jgi:hypothetical protein
VRMLLIASVQRGPTQVTSMAVDASPRAS